MAPRRAILLFALTTSAAGCVREESLDPPALTGIQSTLLVFSRPEQDDLIWPRATGPEALPAVTVPENLVVRAVFWDRTLKELEISEDPISPLEAPSVMARKVPELPDEEIYETRISPAAITPWTKTDDRSVHDLLIPRPPPAQCSLDSLGLACRELDERDGLLCVEPCMLTAPAPPEPPGEIDPPLDFDDGAMCPGADWLDGAWVERPLTFASRAFRRCAPPDPPVRDTCMNGQVNLPGRTGCFTIGGECTGEFTARPLPGRVLYVKPGGLGDGSSPAEATGTIALAIANANAGDTISIAAGSYQESLDLDKRLRIVGACAAQTTIERTVRVSAAVRFEDIGFSAAPALIAAAQVSFAGVTLRSTVPTLPALRVELGGNVSGSTVAIGGANVPILVSDGSLELEAVLSDVAAIIAVDGPTATATISRAIGSSSVLRESVRVENGGRLVLEGVELFDFNGDGAIVSGAGSLLVLRSARLRAPLQGQIGWGVVARDGGRVVGRAVSIEGARSGGLLVEGTASASLSDLLVLDNGVDDEAGVAVVDRSNVELNRVSLLGNRGPGVLLCGGPLDDCERMCSTGPGSCASLSMTQAAIVGPTQRGSTSQDYGVLVSRGATFNADRVVIAQHKNGGMFVFPSSIADVKNGHFLSLEDASVEFGIGVGSDARLFLSRSEIIGFIPPPPMKRELGVGIRLEGSGARATLSDVHVQEFQRPGGGLCGLLNILVTGGAELIAEGLSLRAGTVSFEGASTRGTLSDFRVDGAGDNAALCLDSAEVTVERMRAQDSIGVLAKLGALTLNDVELVEWPAKAISVEGTRLSGARVRILAASDRTTIALEIKDEELAMMPAVFSDLVIQGVGTAIFAASPRLEIARFELEARFGIDAQAVTDLVLSDGRLLGYEVGIRYRGDAGDEEERSLYTRMLYDPDNLERATVRGGN